MKTVNKNKKNPYSITQIPAVRKGRSSNVKSNRVTQKLPKAFKNKWVAALRSNNYSAGCGLMHNSLNNTFDPIGVAHRIAGVPAHAIANQEYPTHRFKFIPNMLTENNELVERITGFADKGMSFKWTADYIERHL